MNVPIRGNKKTRRFQEFRYALLRDHPTYLHNHNAVFGNSVSLFEVSRSLRINNYARKVHRVVNQFVAPFWEQLKRC
jgi:hypothetical protein